MLFVRVTQETLAPLVPWDWTWVHCAALFAFVCLFYLTVCNYYRVQLGLTVQLVCLDQLAKLLVPIAVNLVISFSIIFLSLIAGSIWSWWWNRRERNKGKQWLDFFFWGGGGLHFFLNQSVYLSVSSIIISQGRDGINGQPGAAGRRGNPVSIIIDSDWKKITFLFINRVSLESLARLDPRDHW